MGAFLHWDRDDHFAVDHGISGISRKTIRFYDGETDIGFAAYPAAGLGSLMVQTLAQDTPGFREACGGCAPKRACGRSGEGIPWIFEHFR